MQPEDSQIDQPVDTKPIEVTEAVAVEDAFDVSKSNTEATIKPQENGEYHIEATADGENVSQEMAGVKPPFVLMYDPSVKNFKTFEIDPDLKFVRFVGE